ncbi:MAG TPA: SusC/RagA family TonB-linked outer membrane protein [Bacteroidales bacterium]|nr:SusC/RagA family TonB-linked outer membrane protein [Bacteroidales bacterium]
MKLILVLTVVLSVNVSGSVYSQNSRMNIDVKDKSIREILKVIEKQSQFRFFYNDEFTDLNKTISIALKNKSIEDILSNVFKQSEVTFKVMDNNFVVITPTDVAQQQTVSGAVTDAKGEPLTGVNIVVEGTTIGTVTDFDGKYVVTVPNDNAVLIFSFVGYLSKKEVTGGRTTINVTMEEDIQNLQEVVVTALGIKREKKALSYSSQQLSEEEISKGRDMNFISSLSGRTAGIDLRKSNSGAGGSSKIILRGTKSFYGSSQPLFVIDGVPMANYQTSDATGMWGGYDSGDGLSNLNPDDIESINVLKGANAATLYGSQGSNGVIVITTKKGTRGKARVEVSSSTTFQKASILPELQTTYGQTSTGSNDSWGAKGSYENPADDFFKTGVDYLNSVSVSGGNEMTSAFLSYANSHSDGIIPSNSFNKNNLTFSQKSHFFKNLEVSSNIMLTEQKINNKSLNGYYFNPLTGLYLFPRGLDFNSYKDNYEIFDPNRNMMTQNWVLSEDTQQNPYWIIHNNKNTESTKRVIANLELSYRISSALSVQARGNYDYSTQIFEQKIKAGTQATLAPSNGRWIYSNTASSQQYVDVLLNYNKDFGGVFDVTGVLGASYQKMVIGDGTYVDTDQSNLIVPNEFYWNNIRTADNLGNSTWKGTLNSVMSSREKKESVFANLSVGYKKMLYLDLSARNEWSSTLAETPDYSYFYPSVGVSAILNEMLSLPQAISFAKVRTSYSYVGKQLPSFMTVPMNTISSKDGIKYNTQVPLRTLKPEMQKSLEIGAEMRFLGNRLGFEATYYHIDNMDEFLKLKAPSGSGYEYYFANAGQIRNTGVEVTVSFTPVKTDNFAWKSDINYAKNDNEIIKLDPTLPNRYALEGGGEGYDMFLTEGGSIGDIYVNAFKRDDKGNLILNDKNLPQKAYLVRVSTAASSSVKKL